MKTLKELTTTLEAAGCFRPKMERSYKRVAGYREVLIRCFYKWVAPEGAGKLRRYQLDAAAKIIHAGVMAKVKDAGFELTHESWEWSAAGNVEIWVQAKVAPSDQY